MRRPQRLLPALATAAATALLVSVVAPEAAAEGYSPDALVTEITGDTVHYQARSVGPAENDTLRLFDPADPSDSRAAFLVVIDADLTQDAGSVALDSNAGEMLSASASASWGNLASLVADPVSGMVWEVNSLLTTPSIEPFVGATDDPGGDTPWLCSVVALATRAATATGGTRVAWFAEGSQAGTLPPWSQFGDDCPKPLGGIHGRSASGVSGQIADAGTEAFQVPTAPSKGLAVELNDDDEAIVYAVVSASDGGTTEGTSRVLRFDTSGEEATTNWTVPNAYTDGDFGIGQPHLVEPLSDGRLAVGGDNGILIFDRYGNLLDSVWVKGAVVPEEIEDAARALDLTSSPDGEELYALFASTTEPDGRLLARWNVDIFQESWEAQLCVTGEGEGCTWLDEPTDCDAECATVNDAVFNAPNEGRIRVPPGVWDGGLFIFNKAITIEAEVHGTTELVGDGTAPVVAAYYSGPPGVTLQGLVLSEGSGTDIGVDGLSGGGGIAVLESELTLKQCLLMKNTADVGAGIAALAARGITLENVGFYRNSAEYGAGLFVAGGGLHPQTSVTVDFSTFASNDASGYGAALCGKSAFIEMSNSIVANNGDHAFCGYPVDGTMGADVSWTDLHPEDDWTVWDAFSGAPTSIESMIGDGTIHADPAFVDLDGGDLHLGDDSPAIDAGDPEETDWDGSRADMGMFGGGGGEWSIDIPGDDDDDVTEDDDDATEDDDDATEDDDDVIEDDDDIEALPAGLRCSNCSSRVGSSANRSNALLVLVLAVGLGTRRRRRNT